MWQLQGSLNLIELQLSHVMRKTFLPYANNKDADQPAHLRSLIITFIVHCLDSIIDLISITGISNLYLASVAAQASLSLPWSQTSKTGFPVTWLNYKTLLQIFEAELYECMFMPNSIATHEA